jgi:hypothetical protein
LPIQAGQHHTKESYTMPANPWRHYTLRECATLPTEELKEAARQDFMALVDVTVAEASQPDMRASTKEWLRSPEQIEQWTDALRWADSSLQNSVDVKTYTQDARLKQTARLRNGVARRLAEANQLRGQYKRDAYKASDALKKDLDPDHRARVWLALYFRDETLALRTEIAAQRGINPFRDDDEQKPKHWGEDIEIAYRQGLFFLEETPAVAQMRAMSDARFVGTVAKDAATREDRIVELRHPLLLHRWDASLRQIAADTQAGDAALMSLPRLDRNELQGMPKEQAMQLLARRRRFTSVEHRFLECRSLTREVMGAIQARRRELDKPRVDLTADVRVELVQRHPDEYAYIRQQIAATLSDLGRSAGEPRNMSPRQAAVLKDEIFSSLESGSWH